MKGLKILALAIFTSLALSMEAQSIQGNFKYSDKGKVTRYIFSGDSSLTLVSGADSVKLTYAIDSTQSPLAIDLQYYDSEGNPGKRAPGVMEYIGKDKIRLRLSQDMKRPIGFLPKGNPETIMLIREKQ